MLQKKTKTDEVKRYNQSKFKHDILGTDKEGCIHVRKSNEDKFVVISEKGIDTQVWYNELPDLPGHITPTQFWVKYVEKERGWQVLQFVDILGGISMKH